MRLLDGHIVNWHKRNGRSTTRHSILDIDTYMTEKLSMRDEKISDKLIVNDRNDGLC